MKGWLAMLFSVALIVSQAAFVPGAGDSGGQGAGAPVCCGHCQRCKGRCCVGNHGLESPRSTPAVPSQGGSQNDWQLSTPAAVRLFAQATTQSLAFSSPFFVPPSVAAPLYQRNCSYRI
jgi:hypothetical protein